MMGKVRGTALRRPSIRVVQPSDAGCRSPSADKKGKKKRLIKDGNKLDEDDRRESDGCQSGFRPKGKRHSHRFRTIGATRQRPAPSERATSAGFIRVVRAARVQWRRQGGSLSLPLGPSHVLTKGVTDVCTKEQCSNEGRHCAKKGGGGLSNLTGGGRMVLGGGPILLGDVLFKGPRATTNGLIGCLGLLF